MQVLFHVQLQDKLLSGYRCAAVLGGGVVPQLLFWLLRVLLKVLVQGVVCANDLQAAHFFEHFFGWSVAAFCIAIWAYADVIGFLDTFTEYVWNIFSLYIHTMSYLFCSLAWLVTL